VKQGGVLVHWPQALKEYRRRRGLTQSALAEVLDVDPTTISRWERGRDRPALGIQRRLKSLVLSPPRNVEAALKMLIDTSDTIAVLFDSRYRLLHSSPKHRGLLRLDTSELYGRPFQSFQSESQAAVLECVGGPNGWFRNGVIKMEGTLLRKAFERARNPSASAQRCTAWTIRDGVDEPLVLGISREIPMTEYKPNDFLFSTLDDPPS
jgi:transcriptional regulator with XRE-family HTH domain